MRLKLFAVGLILLIVLASCKNDLKLAAPYKDIPYVHAILTPQEQMQMIRINKLVQGDGNGLEMAQIPDSVNYKPGELNVMLERFVNGVKTAASPSNGSNSIVLRDTIIETKPGVFTSQQRVYITYDKLYLTGVYKLTIVNKTTGNTFSATAPLLDSVPISIYGPFSPPFYPVVYTPTNPSTYYMNYAGVNNDFSVKTIPVKGAALHDLTIRMHYYDSLNNGNKEFHFIDYSFQSQPLSNIQGDGRFSFAFSGHQFYSYIGDQLAKKSMPANLLGRKMYKIDYIAYAGSSVYEDYMRITAPSLTFNQLKAPFSNFEDGKAIGIFTIRTKSHVSKEMAKSFISEFSTNKYTCQYRFYDAYLQLPSCP